MANTTAPLSEVAIANMAATTLDDIHLNSLDEDTPMGRFMASNFGPARDELLASHAWVFAKTRKWTAKTNTAPVFGYKYQYQLPTDYIRMLPMRECGHPEGAFIRYTREGRTILADYPSPLPLVYIQRVTDCALFDPLFARALGQYLAVMASQRVTGKDSYFAKANGLFAQSMAAAQAGDALEHGPQPHYNNNDVLGSRLGGLYGSGREFP
jgi:hypothetical protein